jgi:hypothetical protein
MNSQTVRVAEMAAGRASDEFQRRYRSHADRAPAREALDESTIAALSDQTIARMTRHELVRMICAADLPLPSSFDAERLRLQDQTTLERLAFLARRACRNRVAILGCCSGHDNT